MGTICDLYLQIKCLYLYKAFVNIEYDLVYCEPYIKMQ